MNKANPSKTTAHRKPYALSSYKVILVREGSRAYPQRPQMENIQSVAELLQTYLADADREHFLVLFLDNKNRPIGLNTVSMGSLDSTDCAPTGGI